MAVTIIESSKEKFRGGCEKCGTQFDFTQDDCTVDADSGEYRLPCPQCSAPTRYVPHPVYVPPQEDAQ